MTIRRTFGLKNDDPPTFDIYCDDPHCDRYTRENGATKTDARWYAIHSGGWFNFGPADYCPDHA
jgi:hypothetical protein